jgi:hypothetical protein
MTRDLGTDTAECMALPDRDRHLRRDDVALAPGCVSVSHIVLGWPKDSRHSINRRPPYRVGRVRLGMMMLSTRASTVRWVGGRLGMMDRNIR